ncbi:MAG: deoxyribose-phosphate aldolase [Acutalibacter sp.]|jgi:deoxyribose-phosphate aldolase
MEWKELLTHVDHTLLRPDARWEEIQRIVDEGIQYGTASVCIPPSYVSRAAQYAQGQVPICTVIGFPNGYHTAPIKAAEATNAVQNGAAEIDMVVNLGWVKDGLFGQVGAEIQTVKNACQGRILKVIIETCLLTDEEKIKLCQVVSESGADYIKTSTGFSTGGATAHDVALLRKYTAPQVKVKAAGGIASKADAEEFLALGADRLGTSRLVKLAKEAGM